MKIVAALGGNALMRKGEPLEPERQRAAAAAAARSLAAVAGAHTLVVTHGNGPQVGLLALQSLAYADAAPFPLDVLGAQSEGMIGYVLEQELDNQLDLPIVTVLTRVCVAADDPAFEHPTKQIGPSYADRARAEELAARHGWTIGEEPGSGWRRLVPSPEPREIIPIEVIRLLVDAGVLVICSGGGGVPVVREPDGSTRGIEAVIDKDLSSAVLALALEADALVLLTDEVGVYEHFATPDQRLIRRVSPDVLRSMQFAPGSMAPKVDAVCRFVEATGESAAIGCLDDVARLLTGETGTCIVPGNGIIEHG